jgi:2-amino-4-hydroxy-6-hydroxymethyldihydropteridine diphosphokinase
MSDAVTAVLALGGNLGDREQIIRDAVSDLNATDGIKVKKLSPLVESFAFTEEGLDETKPKYLNAVVQVKTTLKPKALLDAVRSVETKHGRVRLERWGSRTLDIDIITYGSELRDTKTLMLPHPRAYERAFVLVPWSLLDANAVLPGHGKVKDLAEALKHEVWLA